MEFSIPRKEGRTQLRRKMEKRQRPSLLSRNNLLGLLLFLAFAIAAIQICLAGLSPAGPLVVKNQIVRSRIIAEIPFSYVSGIETERTRAEIRQRTPPVYSLDQKPVQQFSKWIKSVDVALDKYLSAPDVNAGTSDKPQKGILKVSADEMETFLTALPGGNRYNINGEDLAMLANAMGADERAQALDEGLRTLTDLYRQGVYDEARNPVQAHGGNLSFMKIASEGKGIEDAEVLSKEQAVSDLKINLSSIDIPRNAFVALFRIMRCGLEPNLVFDQQRTNQIIDEALSKMAPQTIRVGMGDSIVEPGMKVTDLQFEQLQAYRKALRENEAEVVDSQFFDRSLIAVAAILAMMIFLLMRGGGSFHNLRDLLLLGLVMLVNLGLIRLVLNTAEGSIAQTMPTLAISLPWLAPVALSPILIAITLGSWAGIVAAFVIAVFTALMQGSSMAIAITMILAALAGISACRRVQARTRIVRAGMLSGLVLALCALFFAVSDAGTSNLDVFWEFVTALINGFLTGVIVVGLLPIFERLFRHTTDITLLELTDFNHPLLRKMQVSAPGSYHHSLMVANLAENAATQVGANPLACRVASLYHDIGKIVKPEYFIENQRDSNPHMEKNPSISALIIKAHVKEGVVLARQYGLPKIVLDVIREHHGTSLIQYFYYMALKRQESSNAIEAAEGAPRVRLDEVTENTYRYEGPRPQTLESAIVMLADGVEAAGRSLKKATPQSIEDLVYKITQGRIDDGQLDEAPITMSQIAQLRKSFNFSLINMLHSRIEYPTAETVRKTRVSVQPVEKQAIEATTAEVLDVTPADESKKDTAAVENVEKTEPNLKKNDESNGAQSVS